MGIYKFVKLILLIFFPPGGTLGTAATTGEELGENLPQRHVVHHKSHMTRPGFEPRPPQWEASD
jgi:hypothetical protein